jgi:hypothetical protein
MCTHIHPGDNPVSPRALAFLMLAWTAAAAGCFGRATRAEAPHTIEWLDRYHPGRAALVRQVPTDTLRRLMLDLLDAPEPRTQALHCELARLKRLHGRYIVDVAFEALVDTLWRGENTEKRKRAEARLANGPPDVFTPGDCPGGFERAPIPDSLNYPPRG